MTADDYDAEFDFVAARAPRRTTHRGTAIMRRVVTADDLARAFHDHYRQHAAGSFPDWDGMQDPWRREKVAAWQSMLDAGWTFTPPKETA